MLLEEAMVEETRARWLDIGAKSQYVEPPPESRLMVEQMLGRVPEVDSSSVLEEMLEDGLVEFEVG